MAYRLGAGAWVALAEESTWGTAASSGWAWIKPSPGDEDLNLVHEVIEVDSLTSGRGSNPEQHQKGFSKVEGTLAMNLRFDGTANKIFAMLMSHLTQDTATTSGSNPYTHIRDFGYTSAIQPKGITIISWRDGETSDTSTDDVRRFTGCRPTAVSFSFDENSVCRAEFTIVGKTADWTSASALTPAFSTDAFMRLPSPATSPTDFFKVDWNRGNPDSPSYGAVKCRSASLTIEQPQFEERSLQSANPAGLHYEDKLMILAVCGVSTSLSVVNINCLSALNNSKPLLTSIPSCKISGVVVLADISTVSIGLIVIAVLTQKL